MKKGLVLEGGGIRGIFTAGVLDVLMEEGIEFDGGIGVSAGAAFGCNYKSRQPRRAIRYNLKYAKDPRYSSVRSLLKTGDLFNAQFCYHDIPNKLFPFDFQAFRENPMEFYLVCTDVETGKPVYHLCDHDSDFEMLEWFRASGSMPLVSRIVEIGDRKLLDGGISDSIPLRFMEEQGYERNVVVLTRPASYVKEPVSMMRVISRALHKYPETVQAMADRHKVYNETLAYIRQREAGKYAFVIRPEEDLDVGRIEHDRYKIREAYKAGRKMARKRLSELRRFLAAADNDQPEVKTNTTKASIIKNPPGIKNTSGTEDSAKKEIIKNESYKESNKEEPVTEEFVPAAEEAMKETAPAQSGSETAAPAQQDTEIKEETASSQEKTREDMTPYRGQVFMEVFEKEKTTFERPVSFVERQEAAARREAEEVIAKEREAAEKAAAVEAAALKAAAEIAAAEKEAALKAVAEIAAAEKKAAEKAAALIAAREKAAAEKAAAIKAMEEKAAAEKAAALKAAKEMMAAVREAAEKKEAEGVIDGTSGADSPLVLRSRRQKKAWKPGKMTALKEQNKKE